MAIHNDKLTPNYLKKLLEIFEKALMTNIRRIGSSHVTGYSLCYLVLDVDSSIWSLELTPCSVEARIKLGGGWLRMSKWRKLKRNLTSELIKGRKSLCFNLFRLLLKMVRHCQGRKHCEKSHPTSTRIIAEETFYYHHIP